MRASPNAEVPQFAPKSPFWRELSALAGEHLAGEAGKGRPRTGDPRLLRKAVAILVWFTFSYAALLLATTLPAVLLATLSLAVSAAAISFSIFHDANHGTLFRRPAANLWAARLCSVLLGPSRHFWVHKHQGLHHRQPNVIEWDDDLETRGMLRLSPQTPWQPHFRHQQVKALLYYGLNSLEWVFWKDFHCVARRRLNEWHPVTLDRRELTELFASKALYLLIIVIPPFALLPFLWAALSFFLFHLLLSWILAAVFQLAHFSGEMEFGGVRAGDDWAMHQVRTTADFATSSRFATWFTGGLNHQVEHHLFPNVAHSHYAELRPIVCTVAQRHGLRCHDLGSLPAAVGHHLAHLKRLGVQG